MDVAKKILVIEDDQITRDAYVKILATVGQVTAAENCDEALELTKKQKFDLITLDILMPGRNGIEFLKHFNPKSHPETTVLVLSNSAEPTTLKQSLELGAKEYLIKTGLKPQDIVDVAKGLLATP